MERMREGTPLSIGDVARRAGVNVQTIRFYERRGLLPRAPRRPSGYRVFGGDAVRIVRFIKRAQRLGFTLLEVRQFLDLKDANLPCHRARSLAEQKLHEIEGKLSHLDGMRRALKALVRRCARTGKASPCPILEAFEEVTDRLETTSRRR